MTENVHDKGLARDAIGLVSSVAVGVASVTPVTGVALLFGLMIVSLGVHLPGFVLLGFLPILLIASAIKALNRAEPDCGYSFAWVTRAFGPSAGWMIGFLVVASLAVVMTNYAQLLGAYTFSLIGADGAAASTRDVTVLGVAWLLLVTFLGYRGLRLAARVQFPLFVIELVVLVAFGAIALVRGIAESPSGSRAVSFDWFLPTGVGSGGLATGFATAVLLYWGWEGTVALSEETEDSERIPGIAAVASTVILVILYLVCAVGVLAFAGPEAIARSPDDVLSLIGSQVLGSTLDRVLVFTVVTASFAGAIFLPVTAARVLLSMADHGAVPAWLGAVHPRYRTPGNATIAVAVAGLAYYVVLTVVSESVLIDSLTALGLIVAVIYAATGVACAAYFRRVARGPRAVLSLIVGPLVGALALVLVLIKSAIDLADPVNSVSGQAWLGLGAPLMLAAIIVVVGIVLLLVSRVVHPAFFERRPEAASTLGPSDAAVETGA